MDVDLGGKRAAAALARGGVLMLRLLIRGQVLEAIVPAERREIRRRLANRQQVRHRVLRKAGTDAPVSEGAYATRRLS